MNREEKFIHKYQFLKRFYKKLMQWKFKKIKIIGDIKQIKGPCILAPSHHFAIELGVLDAVIEEPVFWISDATKWIGKGLKRLRLHDIPIFDGILKRIGFIEIDRLKIEKFKKQMLEKSLLVFKNDGILGIFPKGGTIKDLKRIKVGIKGPIFLAQQSELQLGIKVPIYPVGVKKENDGFTIKIGKSFYVNADGDSEYRTKTAQGLVDMTEELVK